VLALGQREGTRENAAAALFVLAETLEFGQQIFAHRPVPGLVQLVAGGDCSGSEGCCPRPVQPDAAADRGLKS